MKKPPIKIDFIGIGFPKCGTTLVSEILRSHPEINFSKHKETNFFISSESKIGYLAGPKNWSEYIKEYKSESKKIKGEFSVYYIYHERALKKIKKVYPNIKVFICLRNPVDYLYSTYWYLKNSNANKKIPDTFKNAVYGTSEKYLCNIKYGLFSKYIKTSIDIFGEENIFFILMKDIRNNLNYLIQNIYDFVNVDSHYYPDLDEIVINKSKKLKYPFISPAVNYIVNTSVKLGLNNVLHDLLNGRSPLAKMYRKIFYAQKEYPPMKLSTRETLIDYFDEDMSKVGKLINRDISHWFRLN